MQTGTIPVGWVVLLAVLQHAPHVGAFILRLVASGDNHVAWDAAQVTSGPFVGLSSATIHADELIVILSQIARPVVRVAETACPRQLLLSSSKVCIQEIHEFVSKIPIGIHNKLLFIEIELFSGDYLPCSCIRMYCGMSDEGNIASFD